MGPMECHRGLVVCSGGFLSRQRMSFKPERPGGRKRTYSGVLPPRFFIAATMDFTVMRATQWDRELIAHPATEGPRLRKAQVMSIGRPPTTNQARLLHDVPDMFAIANPPRLGEHQHALIDLWCTGLLDQLPSAPSLRRASFFVFCRDRCQFGSERCLDLFGVGCRQSVLC